MFDMFGSGLGYFGVKARHLSPLAILVLLAVSALYAESVSNFFWMFVAIAALVVSFLPTLKGGAVFGGWKLWVPEIIVLPYIMGYISDTFGYEPFDLKSPVFWVIGSISLFALSMMIIDSLSSANVWLNTSFSVIFTFVLYEALLAMQAPIDMYVNGGISGSYFEDNIIIMGYLILCTAIGLASTITLRVKLGLITYFQTPEKSSWGKGDRNGLKMTTAFTFLIAVLAFISVLGQNYYSIGTGLVSVGLLWIPQALNMRGMVRIPMPVLSIIGFSLLLNMLGVTTGLYDHNFWWDKLTHTMSGFAVASIAVMGLIFLQGLNKIRFSPFWYVFFVFIIVMFFEAIWEIIEFTLDSTVGTTMQYGKSDTVNDLVTDSFAGLIAGLLAAYYSRGIDPDEYIEKCEADRVVQIFGGSL